MERTISRDEARRYYDKAARFQDFQGIYEDGALAALVKHGRFGEAASVFELGCGTGRFAENLLRTRLPPSARYVGVDLSSSMLAMAGKRLQPFAGRATVHQTDGSLDFSRFGGPFDRAVVTYVFDLMSRDDVAAALAGLHDILGSGGLLCAAGLTQGSGPFSKLACGIWNAIFRLNPRLVGGCRPLVLAEMLDAASWRLVHREVVVNVMIASEVVIAERR